MMKVINYYGEKHVIQVQKQLTKIGSQTPYFSVTANIYKATKSGKIDKRYRDMVTGGCCHEEILKAYPGMADLIALHLSDIDGKPMHAVANGWYWLEQEKYDVLARHLRIDVDEAKLLKGVDKEYFTRFVEAQYPRWKAEADAMIEKYSLQVKAC